MSHTQENPHHCYRADHARLFLNPFRAGTAIVCPWLFVHGCLSIYIVHCRLSISLASFYFAREDVFFLALWTKMDSRKWTNDNGQPQMDKTVFGAGTQRALA